MTLKQQGILPKLLPFYFLLIFLLGFFSFLEWDENTYLANARFDSNYIEDFRFPLLSITLKLIFLVTGESLFIAKLFMAFITTISVFLFYLIAKDIIPKYANTATFLFAFNPLTLLWGSKIYTEFLGIFFILLSFYLFISHRKNFLLFFILSGFTASLAFLSRFTYALWALSLIIILFIRAVQIHSTRRINHFLAFCFGLILPLIPWLLYNHFTRGHMFWNLIQQYTIVSSAHIAEPFYFQLFNLLINFHFIAILCIVGIYKAVKNYKSNFYPLIIFFLLSSVHLLFFVASKAARYWIIILPVIILFSLSFKLKKQFLYAVVIGTLIISTVLIYEDLSQCHSSIDRTIVFIDNNTNSNDAIVSNFWPYFGYSLNLESYSMYGSKDVLRHRHHPKYFVYHNSLGDHYNLTELESWEKLEKIKEFSDCEGTSYIFKVVY